MLIKMVKLLLLRKHLILECRIKISNFIYNYAYQIFIIYFSPNFSFQKCIPEDESTDVTSGASTAENSVSSTNPTEIPTRRILRRHDKHPNHEHSHRNGHNDEHMTQHIMSTNKSQPMSKPYSERVNNYAETRARIFNETTDISTANRNTKINQKQHLNYVRPSYRKQQQQHQNSSQQHRSSYSYQHTQQTANTHMQQYPTGKTIDPSSHMMNTSSARSKYGLLNFYGRKF